MTKLTDLPLDILLLIAQHITTAQDFLALCSSCHELQDAEELRYSSQVWTRLVNTRFRVPNRPVVRNDGRRWHNLYRRLFKETKLYVWGNNDRGSLGKPYSEYGRTHHGRARGRVQQVTRVQGEPIQRSAGWPQELEIPQDAGVVADLQCGGWCTAALTASGRIFLAGSLGHGHAIVGPGMHEYLPPPQFQDDRFQQFSVGRSHMLALGDSGRVYAWDGSGHEASALTFDLPNMFGDHSTISVAKVIAGWGHSSAFIPGTGLVVWNPVNTHNETHELRANQALSDGVWIVPFTATITQAEGRTARNKAKLPDDHRGSVVNWVILEGWVVYVTDTGRLFASPIPNDLNDSLIDVPELTSLTIAAEPGESPGGDVGDVIDVQGNFRFFAALKGNGEVLVWNQTAYDPLAEIRHNESVTHQSVPSAFRKIPALQRTRVIQLAFGDWHFHALHADGTISSYGKELHMCGSLGLGDMGIDQVRGIKALGFGGDGELLAQCNSTGRRVHFESEKQDWMNHVRTGGHDKREAEQRMLQAARNDDVRAEVSEWFEQRLRGWEDVLHEEDTHHDPEDDGLPAYVALSVAASGWHSGALVLKNEKKAGKIRDRYNQKPAAPTSGQSLDSIEGETSLLSQVQSMVISAGRVFLGLPAVGPHLQQMLRETSWIWENETFPRLKLKSGEVMPGEVPVEDWTCPEWKVVDDVEA